MKSSAPTVLCFGEILWDFLPSGLFAGGAPFNVAFHLHELGLDARPVSAVGRDLRGDELLRRLHDWKIPTDLVARHAGMPTGYVRARIAPAGDAHYDITRDVAWDRIVVESDTVHVASHARSCSARLRCVRRTIAMHSRACWAHWRRTRCVRST